MRLAVIPNTLWLRAPSVGFLLALVALREVRPFQIRVICARLRSVCWFELVIVCHYFQLSTICTCWGWSGGALTSVCTEANPTSAIARTNVHVPKRSNRAGHFIRSSSAAASPARIPSTHSLISRPVRPSARSSTVAGVFARPGPGAIDITPMSAASRNAMTGQRKTLLSATAEMSPAAMPDEPIKIPARLRIAAIRADCVERARFASDKAMSRATALYDGRATLSSVLSVIQPE